MCAKRAPRARRETLASGLGAELETKPVLLRGISPAFMSIDEIEEAPSNNWAIVTILNNLAKQPELVRQLLRGERAKSDFEKITEVLALLWSADHAFNKGQTSWSFDAYRRLTILLRDPAYAEFSAEYLLSHYRCGFLALDFAEELEKFGIQQRSSDAFVQADKAFSIALACHRQYLNRAPKLSVKKGDLALKDWTADKVRYNSACTFALWCRALCHRELFVRKRIKQDVADRMIADIRKENVDYEKYWSSESGCYRLGLQWRDLLKDKKLESRVEEYAWKALGELREMVSIRSQHTDFWIHEAKTDRDFVFLRHDREFGESFNVWTNIFTKDRPLAGTVMGSFDAMWTLIQSENPEIASDAKSFMKEEPGSALN